MGDVFGLPTKQFLWKMVKRLLRIFADVKKEYSDVFEKNDEINLDDDSLLFVINKLQKISFVYFKDYYFTE